MNGRRIIFRNKTAAPVAPFSVGVPILLVKSVTPVTVPLEPVPDPDPGFDFGKPMTGHMFDLVCKALHAGEITVRDAARANDAYICGRPLPHDLIELVRSAGWLFRRRPLPAVVSNA